MATPWLGVIADDYTGATDVAAALRRSGVATALAFDVPQESPPPDVTALVVALKSRTIPAEDAVAASLASLAWLRDAGVEQTYIKYCSTFDSTAEGNIGPVTDAVMDALDSGLVIAVPASPEHGRTVFQGHMFVGTQLLSESSMARHPLTPMTDPNLVRVLASQTTREVGLLSHDRLLGSSSSEVIEWLDSQRTSGVRHLIADTTDEDDLARLAEVCMTQKLVSGSAGLARAMGVVYGDQSERPTGAIPRLPEGDAVVVAGSCSDTTLRQVALAKQQMPAFRVDPAVGSVAKLDDQVSEWLDAHSADPRVLVYSSASIEERRASGQALGPDTGEKLEQILARAAARRVAQGSRRVIVAGGETSGAVVNALRVHSVLIGEEADRGVPWCIARNPELALLLKSGNFGSDDLLERTSRE